MNDYKLLYETSKSFQVYVDRYCVKHNIPKENAFKHLLVRSYGDYIIKENRQYDKTNNAD